MNTIVRKLSDGEELVVVGQVPISKSTTNPRDSSIERRSLAMSESVRDGSGKAIAGPRLRPRLKE